MSRTRFSTFHLRPRRPSNYRTSTRSVPIVRPMEEDKPFDRFVIEGLTAVDAFNGATVRIGNRRLLAYRARDGERSIGLAWLDENLRTINGTVVDLPLTRNEDPRLLRLACGDVLMSTNYWAQGMPNQIELRKVDASAPIPTIRDDCVLGKFDTIHNWPEYTRRQEKNWVPFEWESSICFAYSLRPHRVLRFDSRSGTVSLLTAFDWPLPEWWQRQWGHELRLSAPPVRLLDGSFVGTWHTCTRAGYWTGFYEFEGAPPFRIIRLSKEPFLTPSDATAKNRRNPSRNCCVFICGMEVDERRDDVLLSGGDNDEKVVVLRTSLDRIRANLRPVAHALSRIKRYGNSETTVVHVTGTPNIGDLASAPSKYFDLGRVTIRDLEPNSSYTGKDLIVGGGGLLGSWYGPMIQAILRSRPRRLIMWGVGLNDAWRQLPDWAWQCELVGVRDDGLGAPWVPCASCCSSLFDAPIRPRRDAVGFFYHARPVPPLNIDAPVMINNAGSMREVVEFLASGRVVVTNSYHGAFWATLLGRRVIVTPPSPDRAVKFRAMRHPPIILLTNTVTDEAIECASAYPNALEECRTANRQFYLEVMRVLR